MDLGDLGSAMYYSTEARKGQLDMERQQANIVAEQQQNQMRQQQIQQEQDRVRDFSAAYSKQVDSKVANNLDQNIDIWSAVRDIRGKKGDAKGVEEADSQVKKIEETKKVNLATQEKIQSDIRQNKARVGDTYNPNNPDTVKEFAKTLYDEGYKPEQIQKLMGDEKFVSAKQKEWHDSALTAEQRSTAVRTAQQDIEKSKKEEESRKKTDLQIDVLKQQLSWMREGKTKSGGNANKVGAVERGYAEQVSNQLHEASAGMDNLAYLTKQGTVQTSAGAFENLSDHGVFGATAKAFTQSLTPQSKQMYASIMLPLARQSAWVGGGGRRITEASVNQAMREFINLPGQTHATMLEKMAEMKQSFVQGGEAKLATNILNDTQTEMVKLDLKKIQDSIPWSVKDAIDFSRSGEKGENFKSWLDKRQGKVTSSKSLPAGFKPL